MLKTPIPSKTENLANTAFDALIRSLSRPGRIRDLPEPGETPIIAALLDRECRVFCADPLLMPQVLASGAMLSEIEEADHVFLGALTDPDALRPVRLGSDLYPDDGATVVVRARLGEGQGLRLTGPGIETGETVRIGGLPDGFWRLRRDLVCYPRGFDVFFVDGAKVIGLPRSTEVEVL
ncbi:phosphonate C-P lyase system protein PhnH [Celeribacter indicus]|uniref:Phosphonate metabolism protein PhnH n=1 Tax=Celeribacter indicus TaxID=1208324 RepID=A0A0B5DXG7_9RHOB|nr:phosphonate C-P lyase system protein PhnH [Celeribacter indicus]AJE45790.1 phosphonate metabolism protein PhnH [Celeribacter indicus]SDW60726.1 alpha-D-ribose 1-methylphosphonate 5-triphosphate synthase subunit PhnH [Celeribacter indicus]